MSILLITEKFLPNMNERDGGAQLAATLHRLYGSAIDIMQFDHQETSLATWHYQYPYKSDDRFNNRINNANFIAQKVIAVAKQYSTIIFMHTSMLFSLDKTTLKKNSNIILFPMFLSPSYQHSGESVPAEYIKLEQHALNQANLIITPSHYEKTQIVRHYNIDKSHIKVIPRGISKEYIKPTIRHLNSQLMLCHIGSIKPQKNTLGVIRLFQQILQLYPQARLDVIGPNQNNNYYIKVVEFIEHLGLSDAINLKGYIAPKNIPAAIQHCHVHLSTSHCETFGRSIFETLALGLPNIVRKANNAATNFLEHLPYIHFVDNNKEAVQSLNEILKKYAIYSNMAIEIGTLYNDQFLATRLKAEIDCNITGIVSDFDGTIYHKNNDDRTKQAIATFNTYPMKVICTARSIADILQQIQKHDIQTDWIIANSGAVITDVTGKSIWTQPIDQKLAEHFLQTINSATPIMHNSEILQIAIRSDTCIDTHDLRIEHYDNTSYISHWRASKLHATVQLLSYINFTGSVHAIGDGLYDIEMLTYFDGQLIQSPADITNIDTTEKGVTI